MPGEVVRSVAVTDLQTCALTESGKVFCWGINEEDFLALSQVDPHDPDAEEMDEKDYNGLRRIDLDARAIHLAAGGDHLCVVVADSELP